MTGCHQSSLVTHRWVVIGNQTPGLLPPLPDLPDLWYYDMYNCRILIRKLHHNVPRQQKKWHPLMVRRTWEPGGVTRYWGTILSRDFDLVNYENMSRQEPGDNWDGNYICGKRWLYFRKSARAVSLWNFVTKCAKHQHILPPQSMLGKRTKGGLLERSQKNLRGLLCYWNILMLMLMIQSNKTIMIQIINSSQHF